MWPQIRHIRRWTQESPVLRQSSQPLALGLTFLISFTCGHASVSIPSPRGLHRGRSDGSVYVLISMIALEVQIRSAELQFPLYHIRNESASFELSHLVAPASRRRFHGVDVA